MLHIPKPGHTEHRTVALEDPSKTKDFRFRDTDRPATDELADAQHQPEETETTHVRDLGTPFMKDFTGTQPHKNFMPVVRDADAPDEEVDEQDDPKDWSAQEYVESFQSTTQVPDDESSALPESIADAVKGNTPPKESGFSMPPS